MQSWNTNNDDNNNNNGWVQCNYVTSLNELFYLWAWVCFGSTSEDCCFCSNSVHSNAWLWLSVKKYLIMKILNMLRSENSYTDTQVGSLVACDDLFYFFKCICWCSYYVEWTCLSISSLTAFTWCSHSEGPHTVAVSSCHMSTLCPLVGQLASSELR